MKAIGVEYEVDCLATQHVFKVKCTIHNPLPLEQRVFMPRWIPGSYLIRNFAKNIISIKLQDASNATLTQLDTATWEINGAQEKVTLVYEIYGFDASVRGIYLDNQRCFFNGSRLCLMVEGKENLAHKIKLNPSLLFPDWQVATTLTRLSGSSHAFGTFIASDYDELIDHPFEVGAFKRVSFTAANIPHDIVISGLFEGDIDRLVDDIQKICEYQISFFGEPAPFSHYLFILNLVGEGYGGLEHRSSTALQATRDCLPTYEMKTLSKEYLSLLGLFSHEYFHAWNVKQIKPKCFMPYNLKAETMTPLLWMFEGFTTYYDDLVLVRAGVISEVEYLKILSEMISRYIRTPGRFKQTLFGASMEAWTKFYQPDENSPNAQISYYLKGALAALCLDLTLRCNTDQKHSLDDVMRWLWKEKGKKNIGVEQADLELILTELGGVSIRPLLDKILHTTTPLPLDTCLGWVGLKLNLHPTPNFQKLEAKEEDKLFNSTLGVSLVDNKNGRYCFLYVYSDSAAEGAGICPNDELIAINHIKMTPTTDTFEKVMKYLSPGQEIMVHVFRRDELIALPVLLDIVPNQTITLGKQIENTKQEEYLKRWLTE